MSIATSLSVMIFTSIAATYGHWKEKAIIWRIVLLLGLGIIVGSIFGPLLDSILPGDVLKIIFACFEILIGLKMLFDRGTKGKYQLPKSFLGMVLIGLGVGFFASLLGVGGGSFMVPPTLILISPYASSSRNICCYHFPNSTRWNHYLCNHWLGCTL